MANEVWLILISAAAAVIPWAASLHAKVAVIAHSVESLPQVVNELRAVLEEHERRLDKHAEEIATLKKTAGAGR